MCYLCYCYFSCLIVSAFFVLLRSLITKTCSRASIVARLRSQNGLGQKWLLCQESHVWFSFSGDLYRFCLHKDTE